MAFTLAYGTEEPGTGSAEVDLCLLEINFNHELIPSIVCSVCLSFGLIYSFFAYLFCSVAAGSWLGFAFFTKGYRCFKMVMFFSGFMFGSSALLFLYHKEPVLDVQLGMETKAGISLGVGVLCGLMTLLVSNVGLLLSGLQLGCLLSLAVLVVIGQFHHFNLVWVPHIAIMAASIVSAVLTLQWQKLFTILYTCVFGATIVMLCVDYLVGKFLLPDQVYDTLCQGAPHQLCWFNWVITGICPVLSLIGLLVQWKFTAKGISHTEAAQKKKQKKHAKKHRHTESRRRSQPHRRRRPPPLKRYAGDVLAPSYLQSLQERQMGTGSSNSSVSTITHTLIDFDFETGSMVPLTASSPVFKF